MSHQREIERLRALGCPCAYTSEFDGERLGRVTSATCPVHGEEARTSSDETNEERP